MAVVRGCLFLCNMFSARAGEGDRNMSPKSRAAKRLQDLCRSFLRRAWGREAAVANAWSNELEAVSVH